MLILVIFVPRSPGIVSSSVYDGTGLRTYCRNLTFLVRVLWGKGIVQEDCNHLQTVFRAAQLPGLFVTVSLCQFIHHMKLYRVGLTE